MAMTKVLFFDSDVAGSWEPSIVGIGSLKYLRMGKNLPIK